MSLDRWKFQSLVGFIPELERTSHVQCMQGALFFFLLGNVWLECGASGKGLTCDAWVHTEPCKHD
jgi:hypothetical protein